MTQQTELSEGVTWEERTTYTTRGLPRTEIVIAHKQLNMVRVIRDASRYVAAEKAAAQVQSWDAKWRDQRFIVLKETIAEQKTKEAQAALRTLQGILHDSLRASCRVEWSELESPFTESKPSRPILQDQPERPTKPEEAGEEPLESKDRYQPELGASFLDVFIPSRWRKRKEEAWQRFEHDHSKWEKTGCCPSGRVMSPLGRIARNSMRKMRRLV
jgi:hypothetical protein